MEKLQHSPGRPDSPVLKFTPDSRLEDMAVSLPGVEVCEITIGNFADGRGFSMVRLACETPGFRGRIRVAGDIITDQVEAYFRCGADEVVQGGRVYQANDPSAWATRPRYQRVLRDRPDIDVLIPQRRQV